MSSQFSGKVALVTGGASGIGRASALAFARSGAKVAVSDIASQEGEKTVQMIQSSGGDAKFFQADVSNSNQVESLVQQVVAAYGRVNFAVNNAGVDGKPLAFVDCPEDLWDQVMDVNLKGAWLCMKYEIPQLQKQGGGAIVNVSSVAGLVGFGKMAPYVSSKHAVIGLTKSAALEYAKQKIRINAVCPGFIDTPMLKRLTGGADIEKQLIVQTPAKRLGTSEEVAEAVVWLCSDSASFVNGTALTVDGGWTAQ